MTVEGKTVKFCSENYGNVLLTVKRAYGLKGMYRLQFPKPNDKYFLNRGFGYSEWTLKELEEKWGVRDV